MKLLIFIFVWIGFLNANNLVVKTSSFSVNQTVKNIEQIIGSKKGLGVFTVINHQKAAKKAGLTMKNTQVIIFGNPKVGTLLMKQNPLSALELPLKILVFEDKENKTKVVYQDIKDWSSEYGLRKMKFIEKISNVLNKITNKATK